MGGDNNPANDSATNLGGTAALRWTHTRVGDGTNHYISTHYDYWASGDAGYESHYLGLLQETRTYSNYGTATAYATTVQNSSQITSYNALGLPLASQTTDGLTPPILGLSESLTYETLRPWLITSITNANNDTSNFTYDLFGRLQKVMRPGDTTTSPAVQYTYWDDPTVSSGTLFLSPLLITTAYKNNAQAETRQFYDGLGRLVQTQVANAEVGTSATLQDVLTTYGYDARGLQTCQTTPYTVTPYVFNGLTPFQTAPCTNYTNTATTYDTVGRPYQVTTPGNFVTTYHYGTWAVGNQIYSYQDVIDPNRHRTQQRTDGFGRLVEVVELSGDCGAWIGEGFTCSGNYTTPWATYATTTYTYNQLDQLAVVTDAAGNTTQMSYDALGRKRSMTDPDMGYWTYTYDPAGNLTSQTDQKNQTITFLYDNLNRLTEKIYNGQSLATYTYDDVSNGNNGKGQLTQIEDTLGIHTFFYNDRGLLTHESRTLVGSSTVYEMTYGYDGLDRLVNTTYPNNETVTTSYNPQGLPETLAGTNTYVTAATYNAAGQRLTLALGNNRTTTNTYHSTTLRLTSLVTNNSLQNLAYTYDNAGNIKTITDALNSSQVQTFVYDHRNRLTAASTNNVGDGQYGDTYSYDEIGNIDTFDGAEYAYDAIHKHAVSGMAFPSLPPHASFSYDGNGNMTSRTVSGTTYTQNWDVENRLTTVTTGSNTTRFYYDANGQRMITAHPDGQVVYTPFPGYEEEIPLTHSLTANGQTSLTIAPNTSFTLAWDSQGATGCTASGSWSGNKNPDDSQTVSGFASGSRTYTLVCSNGSSATSSQSVTVTVLPPPTLTLTGNGQEQVLYVTANQNFTLAWSSSGATSCTASGNWSGLKATSGSQSITGFASGSRTYTLTCTNGYTNSSKSVVVTAYNLPTLNFTVNFSGSNITVQPGTTYTLRWSAAAVSSCTAGGSWSGTKGVAGVQSYTAGSGGSSYTYTLSCVIDEQVVVNGALTVTVEVCQECLGGEETAKPETGQPALVYTEPLVGTLPQNGLSITLDRQPEGKEEPQTVGIENTSAIIRLTYAFGGQTVATRIINGSSTLYYIHNDHLGSNSRMSTSAGSAVTNSIARYTPFGDWRTEPTATLTDRGYTGHLHNNLGSGSDDLGLIYMNARYYLPSSGRFISPDTIVPDTANPQSWNRYSYVENNPLRYTDPTGHKTCEFICPAEHILWNAVTGSAWYGPWDREAQEQNQAQAQAVVDVGGQIICGLYDPCDYVQTGVNIVQGEAGVLETFAMATPILPAVVGRWGDDLLGWGSDVVQWAGNMVDDAIGAFCSFSEDTLVMTEDGLMPISEVGLYEMVLAYNEETGEVGYYPVVAVWAHEDPVIVTLTIEGETIETTPEHPFYTDEGEWLPAASLQVGDEIRTSDWGTGTVEAIQFTHNPQLMYNFTVATAHTYFVGEGQWLVHNECADYITQFWKKFSVTDGKCQSGCLAAAEKIQGFIGGEVVQLTSNLPQSGRRMPLLPSLDGYFAQWQDHWVVFKDGRVYDAFTGHLGQSIEEYMARWSDPDLINWPWD